jgi:hypothetical protein
MARCQRSFLIDGEAVVADVEVVASFDLLRGRAREKQAFVWGGGDPLPHAANRVRRGRLRVRAETGSAGPEAFSARP